MIHKAPAPVVIAKGQDYLAKRIKEVAKENNVEVVENKPLAQTLYRTVDIGQKCHQLYQAVAEILALFIESKINLQHRHNNIWPLMLYYLINSVFIHCRPVEVTSSEDIDIKGEMDDPYL